jgi:hypothetical protein
MTSRLKITPSAVLLSAVLIFIVVMPDLPVGHAVSSANLAVASSGTVFAASRNNTLSLEISNVGKYLKELDVALTVPPPLVLFGDNHWIRSSFPPREVIRAELTVFAPSSAAGTTLQGSVVAVYKVVGETIASTETHAISFLIRGWIDIKVYDLTVTPDPALPGSEITVSGNLLNRGVIAAMYANVTITPDRSFVPGSIKSTYVGQVDPNAPAPFSVTAVVDAAATAANYETTILVQYRDDLQIDHTVSVPISYTIVSELPQTQTTKTGIVDQLLAGQTLLAGLGVIIVLVVVGIFLRRRRKAAQT